MNKINIDIVIPVKNCSLQFENYLLAWCQQVVPLNVNFKIIVVDDGSTNDRVSLIEEKNLAQNIIFIYAKKNGGRSKARNTGAMSGQGEYILFVDADCIPLSKNILYEYSLVISKTQPDLLFGSLSSSKKNFWGRYFREVSLKRENDFIKGNKYSLTSANCVVKRNTFEDIHGFNEKYKKYGFEDRDLIIRLIKKGATSEFVKKAIVLHEDTLSINSIYKKMHEASQFSAPIFIKNYPEIYKNMGFSKADFSQSNKFIKIFLLKSQNIEKIILYIFNYLINAHLAYSIKSFLIKILSAYAYALGSIKRDF